MKLGLGTVQFGVDYGISNQGGRTSPQEAGRILSLAETLGIAVLDTAPLYGTSEEVLGSVLPAGHRFRIVTKTPKFPRPKIEARDAAELKTVFRRSLEKLGAKSVHGLMIHDSDDLLRPGGELLVEAMEELKADGLASRIGASIYTGGQVDGLRSRFSRRLDILQAPVNILDQRLISSGRLKALKADGWEIHARSVFLQGVLLMDPSDLPPHFGSVRGRLEDLRAFLDGKGVAPLRAALGFVAGLAEVDSVVCGVNTADQLNELGSACSPLDLDLAGFSISDESILNPSLWRK